jgi:cytochrome c nitrite reductase small subunit
MRKLLITLAVLSFIALLTLGGTASHQLTTSNQFCASCHAYEKTSWDHGPHAQAHAGCLDCHTGGFVSDKVQGVRKVVRTLTGQIDPHRDWLTTYPQKTLNNCMGCHFTPAVTESESVFVRRHESYLQMSETCLGCHEGGHDARIREMRFAVIPSDPAVIPPDP